jgi:hypothetical protein
VLEELRLENDRYVAAACHSLASPGAPSETALPLLLFFPAATSRIPLVSCSPIPLFPFSCLFLSGVTNTSQWFPGFKLKFIVFSVASQLSGESWQVPGRGEIGPKSTPRQKGKNNPDSVDVPESRAIEGDGRAESREEMETLSALSVCFGN